MIAMSSKIIWCSRRAYVSLIITKSASDAQKFAFNDPTVVPHWISFVSPTRKISVQGLDCPTRDSSWNRTIQLVASYLLYVEIPSWFHGWTEAVRFIQKSISRRNKEESLFVRISMLFSEEHVFVACL